MPVSGALCNLKISTLVVSCMSFVEMSIEPSLFRPQNRRTTLVKHDGDLEIIKKRLIMQQNQTLHELSF